jgi:hypothetical protein
MARIKCILNERRLAYEGAVKLLERQRAEEKHKSTLADAVVRCKDANISFGS